MKQSKQTAILVLSGFLLFVVLLPTILTITKYLLALFHDPITFQQWLMDYGSWAYGILFLWIIGKVIFPILPAKVMEIAAGYCFGFTQALFLVLAANAIGTLIVRILVKRFGEKLVWHFVDQKTLQQFPLWQKETRFAWILFLTYFIPGTPKDALTYVIALSNMKTWKLVLITTMARVLTVVFGVAQGCALETGDYIMTGILAVIFALLSGFGLWFYQTCLKSNKET